MKNDPECYGRMFLSLISLVHNETVAGKVFGYRVEHSGTRSPDASFPPIVKLGGNVCNALISRVVTGCQSEAR
jgi:hypothetical protein